MNLKDLKTARIIMVLIIAVSSLLQGVLGLRSLYKDVQKEFYNGSSENVAVYSDIKDAAEYGFLIKKVLVLNEYLAADSNLAKAVDLSYDQFKSADVNKPDSMKEGLKAFDQEKKAVEQLIKEADQMNLDESTLKSYRQYKAEYEESLIFVSRSDFKETALSYNKILDQFPASLLKKLAGVEILPEFQ